jgi:hypothetical protein
MVIEGSRASKARDNVVLPAPEGDDMTSSRPRLAIFVRWTGSLNVLHLLA